MALDLGELSATIRIDSSKAERDVKDLQKYVASFEKSLQKIENNNVNITPKGKQDLDAAKAAAERLKTALDGVGNAGTKTKIGASISSELKQAEAQAKKSGENIGDGLAAGMKGKLAGIGAAVTAAFSAVSVAKAIGGLGMEFDKSMNNMRAVSGATGEQLAAVAARARELGNDADLTATSASDAAAAMTELAKGGFSVADSMGAAKGTLQLAAAAQVSAADAATIQSQALQAFGLGAEDAARVSDILAGAANASSAEMTGIAQGMQQVGTVANGFSVSIEDTATGLAMLANAGIQGSDAGTLLKSAMLALTDQGKPAQKAIQDLGLTVYDAQGKFVGLESLMGQLQRASNSMSEEQYEAAAATLFGSDAIRLAMVAAEQGSEGFAKLEKAVTRQGQAAEVAAAQTQGLPGVVERFQNTVEDLGLEVYDALDEGVVGGATLAINALDKIGPAVTGAAKLSGEGLNALVRLVGELGDGIGAALDSVQGQTVLHNTIETFAQLKDTGAAIMPVITGLSSAFAKAGAALGVSTWDVFMLTLKATGVVLEGIAGPLEKVTGFLDEHPGLVTAALAAWAGFKTIPSIMSAVTGKLAPAKAAVMEFGSAMKQSWVYAGQSSKNASVFSRSMTILSANGVSAAAALSKVKGAAAGVVDAFGGPWGLAITAAVGILAKFHSEAQQLETAQDNMAASTREAAEAQRELYNAFQASNGAMDTQAIEAGAKVVKGAISDVIELGGSMQDMVNVIDAPDLSWWEEGFWNKDFNEYRSRMGEMKDAYGALKDSVAEVGIPMQDLNAVVAEGGADYEALIASLRESGDAGASMADRLEAARHHIEEIEQAARNADEGFKAISEGMSTLADTSSSAEEKVSGLKRVLEEMGIIPKAATDSLWEMNEAITQIVDGYEGLAGQDAATSILADPTAGWDLENLDIAKEAAHQFREALQELADEYLIAMASGQDADASWGQLSAGLEKLSEKTGIAKGDLEKLVGQFGAVPDTVETAVNVMGTNEAVADLGTVWAKMETLKEGETINVGILTDDAVATLEELGYKVKEVKGDDGQTIDMTITAEGEQARSELADVLEKTKELDSAEASPHIFFDTTELKATADEVEAVINSLDLEEINPKAAIDLTQLFADGEATRAELAELSAEHAIPIADLDKALLDAGVKAADDSLNSLDGRETMSLLLGDADNLVKEAERGKAKSDELVDKKVTFTAILSGAWDTVRRFFGASTSRTEHFSAGGRMPAYAGGARHGGYRLPSTGPGTDTTDGFLAVDQVGMPIARLDKNEWVINGERSSRFNRTLGAVNFGTKSDIINAVTADLGLDSRRGDLGLPGYAEGGRATAKELLAFARGQAVNGQQAARSLEGATYDWGGVNWGDCSGAMSALARFSVGLNAFGGRFATMNEAEALAGMGAKTGSGSGARIAFGWFNGGPWGGHTAGTIYTADGHGINVEMGGNRGNGQIGGGAAGVTSSGWQETAHIVLAEGGGDDSIEGIESTSLSSTKVRKKSGIESIDWGTASDLKSKYEEASHKARQLARWRNHDFDSGGVASGVGWLPKNTIKPERVLSSAQTAAFEKLPVALQRSADSMDKASRAMGGATTELSAIAKKEGVAGVGGAAGEFLTAASTGEFGGKYVTKDSQMGQVASAIYDEFGNAILAAQDMKLRDVQEIGKKFGVDFFSEYTDGVLSAHDDLEAAYVAQVDAADALAKANKNVEIAQKELAEAQNGNAELSTKTLRKIQDAEKALADAKAEAPAKSDTDGAKKAEKVAKAEERLKRVREDAAEELEKNGVESLEAVQEAQDNLTAAEEEAAVAKGVVKQAALAAGHAEIAMAVEIAAAILKITQAIVDFRNKAQEGMATLSAKASENIVSLSAQLDAQKVKIAELGIALSEAFMNASDAAFKTKKAQANVSKAQLEGAKNIADIQARIANAWSSSAGSVVDANLYDMGLLWDSHKDKLTATPQYKTTTGGDTGGIFGGAISAINQVASLQEQLAGAQLEQQLAVLEASMEAKEAAFQEMQAKKELGWAVEDLLAGTQLLAEMTGTVLGMTNEQAYLQQQIYQQMTLQAQAMAERDNIGNQIARFFDFNKDGKVFGLLPNTGSAAVAAAEARIKQTSENIAMYNAQLEKRGYQSVSLNKDDMTKMSQAADLWASGNQKAAEWMMQTTSVGRAGDAVDYNNVLSKLEDMRRDREETRRSVEKATDSFNHWVEMRPDVQKQNELQNGIEMYKYAAEAAEAQSRELKDAALALRDDAKARYEAAKIQQPVQVTLPSSGELVTVDRVSAMLTALRDALTQDFKLEIQRQNRTGPSALASLRS